CASFCLREEENPILARCVQLSTECAAICYAAAQLMSMGSKYAHEICRICADMCEACAKECEMHEVDHCERCAIECRACAEECRNMEFAAQD
ncbi:MAG: four-helix bundle copper-binding protein, partial [Saprospiraceae bacterium]